MRDVPCLSPVPIWSWSESDVNVGGASNGMKGSGGAVQHGRTRFGGVGEALGFMSYAEVACLLFLP